VIPAINVDAPFTVRTVGEDGKMPNPQGPTDVAWYDFSGWPDLGGSPGLGGNAVMAGHVDYINYGPAVFWDLRKLAPGDRVTVALDDGSEVVYAVQWNKSTTAEDADWTNIVRATSQESLTLITCAGQFDQGTRQYDERIIVWATRV
jgi:LPXTG-site transpeptidase (sortase) family protein